jgi:hypothetical protein
VFISLFQVVGIILVEEAHTSSLSTIPYPKDSPISPIFEFYAQLMQTALEGRVQDKTFCHVAFHGVEQSGIAHSKVNLALALRYYANSSARRKGYVTTNPSFPPPSCEYSAENFD